jgi:hypothetical protein
VFAALASIMLAVQIGTGDAQAGQNYTLQSIAAVVLGGASIYGGRGSVVGSLLGALLLTELIGALPFLQLAISGSSGCRARPSSWPPRSTPARAGPGSPPSTPSPERGGGLKPPHRGKGVSGGATACGCRDAPGDSSVDFLSLRLNNSTVARRTSANAPGIAARARRPLAPFPR